MNQYQTFRAIPLLVASGFLVACLAGSLLWRVAWVKHANTQCQAIVQALKAVPGFSQIQVRPRQSPGELTVTGTVQTEERFSSLTRLLVTYASDLSIQVSIKYPAGPAPNGVPNRTVVTHVGEPGTYKTLGDVLSFARLAAFAVFLYVLASSLCGALWSTAGPNRTANFAILIPAPFLIIALAFLAFWHLPNKNSPGHPWLVPLTFVCSTGLLTYSLTALRQGPYRLLSAISLAAGFLIVVPSCLISAIMVAWSLLPVWFD
ncbi:MAG: hypothetical protein WC708_14840 [Lentisphaeria bacterium]